MNKRKVKDPQFVVTDNTLLTDAAIVFRALQHGPDQLRRDRFKNWERFIEGVVLHKTLYADKRIFEQQPHIQRLKQSLDIDNCIAGVELRDDERETLNTAIKTQYRKVQKKVSKAYSEKKDDNAFYKPKTENRIRKDLQRALFYLELSNKLETAYHPSISRAVVLGRVFDKDGGIVNSPENIADKTFAYMVEFASEYTENIKKLGGPQLIMAKLPPIVNLIIKEAKKCGSWSEAIAKYRNSRGVNSFRNWCVDVAESLNEGDGRALKKYKKLNDFLTGWTNDPDERIKYRTIEIGIGQLPKIVGFPNIELPDMELSAKIKINLPMIWRPSYFLFLNRVFKATITPKFSLEGMKNIKM
jgi:hypothetical protein